jgi:GNAT superfamily N-acetyltransferase
MSKKKSPFTGIRLAKRSELPRIAVICQDFIQGEMGEKGTDRDHFVGYMSSLAQAGEDALLRVVVRDDQVVGSFSARVTPLRYDRPGSVAVIDWAVLVPSERRRREWGRKIDELVTEWARARGASEVWTSVPLRAETAQLAYRCLGFRPTETLFRKEV